MPKNTGQNIRINEDVMISFIVCGRWWNGKSSIVAGLLEVKYLSRNHLSVTAVQWSFHCQLMLKASRLELLTYSIIVVDQGHHMRMVVTKVDSFCSSSAFFNVCEQWSVGIIFELKLFFFVNFLWCMVYFSFAVFCLFYTHSIVSISCLLTMCWIFGSFTC